MHVIAFTSLFLGLVTGTTRIDLVVADTISSVDIVLDGTVCTTLSAKPWSATCDLGPELLPHELVAIAYDCQRQELGRARQWINLPRPPAEANVVISEGKAGQRLARVSWQALPGEEPLGITVTFDGRPLSGNATLGLPLPEHNPTIPHFLRVELVFRDNVKKHLEIIPGGVVGGALRADLTAVPVMVKRGRSLPPLNQLDGWLMAGGKPARAVAIDRELAEMLVIVDRAAVQTLLEAQVRGNTSINKLHVNRHNEKVGIPRSDHQVRFVSPLFKRGFSGNMTYDVFDLSPPFTRYDGSFIPNAAQMWDTWEKQPDHTKHQRLADAVAIAGLEAARDGQRRAVVLIISHQPEDSSHLTPENVRGYLATLRVPLQVWCPQKKKIKGSPWGKVAVVSTRRMLDIAFQKVTSNLERQCIIWVEGTYLPQQIELTSLAQSITTPI